MGKRAWEGLVKACMSHQGAGFEAERWTNVARVYRRAKRMVLICKVGRAAVDKGKVRTWMNEAEAIEATENGTILPDLSMAGMLRCRVRYFTDGAVIGSKAFVNDTFANARDRFSPIRKDGARAIKGSGSEAKGLLWTVRNPRVGI